MIKKLICLLWGHKYMEVNFSGEYAKESYVNPITLIKQKVPIMVTRRADYCKRCGISLAQKVRRGK